MMPRPTTVVISQDRWTRNWHAIDTAQIDRDRCCNLGPLGVGTTPDEALADYDRQVAEVMEAA